MFDFCPGTRSNAEKTDLSEILPEEVEEEVKAAAEISMGTEVLWQQPWQNHSKPFMKGDLFDSDELVAFADLGEGIRGPLRIT